MTLSDGLVLLLDNMSYIRNGDKPLRIFIVFTELLSIDLTSFQNSNMAKYTRAKH